MNDEVDMKANALDKALSGKGELRHEPGLRPFMETADALRRDAAAASERLDPATATNQRTILMNMAKAQSAKLEARNPKVEEEGKKEDAGRHSSGRLPIWIGSAVAVLAVVVLAVVVATRGPITFQRASEAGRAVARIVIPEARAADALSLVAETQDAAGAAVDTAFRVTSKVDVTADALKQNLRVVPPVPFDVETVGTREFRVTPASPLAPGTVYRLAAATVVQKDDGTMSRREFSWAIQTKDTFRMLSSVPGNQAAGVPANTGIEITMSQIGWEDPTGVFSIVPKVDGRFETHGRALAFVPSKPLAYGTVYTVTVKKGWKIAGSDLTLPEDAVIRFETESNPSRLEGVRIDPAGTFFEVMPGTEAFVSVNPDYSGRKYAVSLTGYALSKDDAKALMAKVAEIPWWAYSSARRGDDFLAYAKRQVFTAQASVERDPSNMSYFIRVPKQNAGAYLVRITTVTEEKPPVSEDSWVVLQVTDVATYAIMDGKETVFWAMDMSTQKPLSSLPVTLEGATAQTDQNGLAHLPTPAVFGSTSTDSAIVVAEAGVGDLSALVPLAKRGWLMMYGNGPGWDSDRTIGYITPDRPLYRISDSLSFFGVAQDRDTHGAPSGITVQLRRFGILDYATYQDKVYAERDVTVDDAGFFRGEMRWDGLSPGTYSIAIFRDGKAVSSRSIEIRDLVKPAFTIDVTTARPSVYAGDRIEGQAKASLFDGTPLTNQKLAIEISGLADRETVDVTTDGSGLASFSFATKPRTCDLSNPQYAYCSSQWVDSITARPVDAEEAQISGSASVDVWDARLSATVEITTDGNDAKLSFLVRRVDLSRAVVPGSQNVLTDPLPNVRLTGRIVGRYWEKIEGPPSYDPVSKTTSPTFRYVLREDPNGTPVDLVTDGSGRATFHATMKDEYSYRLIVSAKDEKGAEDMIVTTFAKGWYDQPPDSRMSYPTLEPTVPRGDRPDYRIDEEVSLTMMRGGAKMPDAGAPAYLFVEAMRGLRNETVSDRSTYTFRFRDGDVPNMTVYGIAFSPKGFTETSAGVSFDAGERDLKVTVTSDPSTAAPAGTVTATVDVRDKDGNPVKDARVALSAVDESLLAASYGRTFEPPSSALYSWVSDGILLTRASHSEGQEFFAGNVGAEMGGGGNEGIRRNFKDTAVFDVMTTDAGGRATRTFTAPDNITSWRLTAAAITPALYSGIGEAKLAVTKPVFVDAVIPFTLLDTDKPVLKIRAFGVGLKAGEPLAFTVDAPTLGIANRSVTGTAGTPAYVAVDRLADGDHAVMIRVAAAGGTDAIERRVTVVPSRFTKDEYVSTELVPGASLPDVGTSFEVEVRFEPLSSSAYLPLVSGLADAWSSRVESKIAERVSRQLLKDVYGRTDVATPDLLLRYQRDSGGIAPLPYASEDAELSAKAAATDPDAFDRSRLADYLWQTVGNKDATREEAIRALSGLASLGEPVLIQLQAAASSTDLSWRERLALGRGLEAAGDREASRAALDALLEKSEDRDGLIRLTVADDRKSILESTAEAAALAAVLGDPRAKGLEAYLEANWADDVLTDLDRAYFLKHLVPTLAAGDVTIRYVAGNGEQTVDLSDGYPASVVLTAAEAKAFRATGVTGPAAATFVRRTIGLPKPAPEVGLKREYLVPGAGSLADLAEGMTVTVVLTPTWQKTAQDGCYEVRDHLPSGLAPFISLYLNPYQYSEADWYPESVGPQDIGFVTCKGYGKPITYTARVVSRGDYTAEPAVMQSMVTPSVTALSAQQAVHIR